MPLLRFFPRSLAMIGLLFWAASIRAAELGSPADLKTIQEKILELAANNQVLAPVLKDKGDLANRLATWIQEDEKAGETTAAQLSRAELDQLVKSLAEDLDIIGLNARLDRDLANKTVSAASYGTRGDGVQDDGPALRKAIAAVLAKGDGWKLSLPKGRYRIADNEKEIAYALILSGATNLLIEGAPGTILVFTKVGGGLLIQNCRNVRIQGISIDYAEQPPCTQGVITKVDAQENKIELDIQDGFVDPMQPYFLNAPFLRGLAWDAALQKLVQPLADTRIKSVVKTSVGYQLTLMDNSGKSPAGLIAPFSSGNIFTIHSRQTPDAAEAVRILRSEHVQLTDVAIRASFHAALLSADSSATKLIRCRVGREPGSQRYWVNNADGIFVRNNRVGPIIYQCSVMQVNDDCLNIHNACYAATRFDSSRDRELEVTGFFGGESGEAGLPYDGATFKSGDRVALVDPNNGETAAVATLVGATWSRWEGGPSILLRFEKPLQGIVTREALGKKRLGGREYVGRADSQVEHFLVNLNTKSAGFIIRESVFGETRTKCLLLKASAGVMRDNRFTHANGMAVKLMPELDWLEGESCRNLIIEGNKIDTPYGILSSYSLARKNAAPAFRNNRRIVIENNVLNSPIGILYSEKVTIRSNQFTGTGPQININFSKDVVVTGNQIAGGQVTTGRDNAGGIVIEK